MKFERLNDAQQEAATHIDGPLVILAGPGSGKTETVSHRYQKMVENGVDPQRVLLTTFSRRAAAEIEERIIDNIEDNPNIDEDRVDFDTVGNNIGTIHSEFFHIIKEHPKEFGFNPNENIVAMEDYERSMVFRRVVEEVFVEELLAKDEDIRESYKDATRAFVKLNMDKARTEGVRPDEADDMEKLTEDFEFSYDLWDMDHDMILDNVEERFFREIFPKYQEKMRDENAIDFSGMQYRCYCAFQDSEQLRKKYENRFKYIIVDEAQDMSPIQYYLVEILSRDTENLCLVADDAQCIYSWRGSDPTLINEFRDEYDADIIKLTKNYRSQQDIVEATNELADGAFEGTEVMQKELESVRGDISIADQPVIAEFEDRKEELYYISDKIKELLARGYQASDMAILSRTNRPLRVYESHLTEEGIQCDVVKNNGLLDTKNVKRILVFLKAAIQNESDTVVLNALGEGKGIGDSLLNRIQNAAEDEEMSVWSYLNEHGPESVRGVGEAKGEKVEHIMQVIDLVLDREAPISFVINNVESVGVKETKDGNTDYITRQQYMTLENTLDDFEITESGINDFFEFIFSREADDEDGDDRITLTTIHKAKGKEWDIVFIPRMTAGYIPLESSNQEEEKRVFYVALSRAGDMCFMTYALTMFNDSQLQKPSEFLAYIDDVAVRGGD